MELKVTLTPGAISKDSTKVDVTLACRDPRGATIKDTTVLEDPFGFATLVANKTTEITNFFEGAKNANV